MEMKEWFVVYDYYMRNQHRYVVKTSFIYGLGTAQEAWDEFKGPSDRLTSITRV